ncbi:MAG TPA: TonB-dependent receptor [Steroidobacteraceae bacterium]|nr:TonB-dependent receptor [Steroidobacteraceae bacterium]
MSKHSLISRAVRLALLVSATPALLTRPAHAQDQDPAAGESQPMEEVVVTGSRILSPNLTSPSPIQSVSAADIQNTGTVNAQDLLLKNPTIGTPTLSRSNSAFLTSGVGVATVDLRNLGIDRTLTLVDGRRFVSGNPGSAAVDFNTIPAQFIERIDVLTGGASAVYGSDAVAGVVNIIYKKNFEGLTFDGQYGATPDSDDQETQIGLTFGTNTEDGRGNIMAHVGYTKQGEVRSVDRKRSAVDQISTGAGVTGDPAQLFDVTRPFYSSFAPQGRFFTNTLPAGVDPNTYDSFSYDANGNVIPWDTNGEAGAATGFNRSQFRTIAVPVERYLFAGRGSFDFTENHGVFFEGTYASSKSSSTIEPFGLGAEDIYPATGGQVPEEFDVDGTLVRNPLVPDEVFDNSEDNDGDGLRDFYFTKRLIDFGNRTLDVRRDTFRVVGGLQGTFASDRWHYEAFYAFGQTKEAQVTSGQVNVLNFRNALESIADVQDVDNDGDTTEAICRDPNARLQGCVPVNVFGFNSITPAARDYIAAPGSLATFTSQRVIGLNTTGEVFDMPAGPFAIAAGLEYRKEFSSSEFDALTQAGLNAGNAIPPTQGDFDVKEAYVEADVPLLADKPFAEQLSLRAAVRASDYSTVGNTLSWNGGFEWAPISALRFRVIRALSTRAPNINELYSPPSQTFPTGVQDPCIGVTATGTDPISVACLAAPGVLQNINDPTQGNGAFALTQADVQGISGFDSGNPDLEEEEGNSWTIGAVIQPKDVAVLDRFNFTVDYYRIDISNAITLRDRNFILSQCYGGGDTSLCEFVHRRPNAVGANNAGSIEFLDANITNAGGEFAEGVDLTVGYSQEVGPGKLNANLSYTHVLDHYIIPLDGGDKDYVAGEVGDSKDRAYLALGYDWNKFGVTVETTYLSAADLDDQFLAAFDLPRGAAGVSSRSYVDLQLRFEPSDTYQVFVGANNLFDTEPPPIISGLPGDVTGTETDAGTYDAIGRRWYAGVRMKF